MVLLLHILPLYLFVLFYFFICFFSLFKIFSCGLKEFKANLFILFSSFYLAIHLLMIFLIIFLGKDLFLFLSFTLREINKIVYDFLLDYVRLVFLRFVSLITFSVIKYRKEYMGLSFLSRRFIILVTLFVISIFMLISSSSFLIIILGWDGLGVTSFLLVIYYNNYNSLSSGLLTIYLNRIGDFLMMITFWGLFNEVCYTELIFYTGGSVLSFSAILVFAAGTKRAQLPFSSWLPAAIAAPTPVSSLVHSSTLVTAGVYLLLRFFYIGETYLISGFLL